MFYKRSSSLVDRGARWVTVLFVTLGAANSIASAYPVSPDDPEQFKIELTGSAWLVNSSGTIQSSGTPIDLVSDLGAEQQQPTFFGQLVFKPGRRHRIVVEGTPFRISGYNTVDRTIVYRGQTFDVNTTVRSSADLNYFFAGYQYDLISRPMGHLGVSVGGAYLGTTGTITSTEMLGSGTATKSESVGLPLTGLEGRIFPVPGRQLLVVEGDIKGMGVGDYGHYLEASGSGGIGYHSFAFLAGYRWVDADLHESSQGNPSGVNVHLSGPIFSLQWRR